MPPVSVVTLSWLFKSISRNRDKVSKRLESRHVVILIYQKHFFFWCCISCYITNCLRWDLMMVTTMHLWTLHTTDWWQRESWDPCYTFGGRYQRKIFVYAKLSLKQQQQRSCKQYDWYYCYSDSAVIRATHPLDYYNTWFLMIIWRAF